MSYARLIELWDIYQAEIKSVPYNADNVQAWGMAFADEWKNCRDRIIKGHSEWIAKKKGKADDLDYNDKAWIIELIR